MTIREALELLGNEFPNKVPDGYWIDTNRYLIKTKTWNSKNRIAGPSIFAVEFSGKVYGVTPVQYDFDLKKMIPLPYGGR